MLAAVKVLRNIRLVTPGEDVRVVSLLLDGDRISAILAPDDQPGNAEILFDGAGEILAFPGFIDIHTHGANGVDLAMAQSGDDVAIIARAKLAEGVTTFLPTTWTASPGHKRKMAEVAAAYRTQEAHARAPFLHVEGPYLNPDQAGAQDPAYMRDPDIAEIEALHRICPVGIVSLAPELDGALEMIRALRKLGIVASAAHSAATFADVRASREAGLTHLTHYCNQMSRLHHREVGLVGAALLDDEVMIEIICDTIHLCPEMIALAFKHRRPEQLMLITDSIAASHLGDGTYPLGDTAITVKNGAARIPAGNLAGSIVQFHEAVGHVARITSLPLPDLARCASSNQARSLGLTDRGTLEPGKLADVALLDPAFGVAATVVGGEVRYRRDD